MGPTANDHFMKESEVFDEIAARGAERAVVSFSGGNDEGGIDRIALVGAGGEAVAAVEPDMRTYEIVRDASGAAVWEHTDPPPGMKAPFYQPRTRRKSPGDIRAARFSDALGAPVYAAYGDFTGDFSVAGELVWDAALRRRYFAD